MRTTTHAALVASFLAGMLVVGAMTPPCNAQSSRFVDWLVADTRALGGELATPETVWITASLAFLIPTSTLDAQTNPQVRRVAYEGGTFHEFLESTNHLGAPEARWPVLGLFAVSLASRNTRFQDAAFTSLQGWMYSGALSYGIKEIVGRSRPHESESAFRFEPLSGHSSFPSGHTTSAFSIITPWVLYYRDRTPLVWGLYALPVGTAMARLERDKHWASDVVAGAALGTFVSAWLVRRHRTDTAATVRPAHLPRPDVRVGARTLSLSVRF